MFAVRGPLALRHWAAALLALGSLYWASCSPSDDGDDENAAGTSGEDEDGLDGKKLGSGGNNGTGGASSGTGGNQNLGGEASGGGPCTEDATECVNDETIRTCADGEWSYRNCSCAGGTCSRTVTLCTDNQTGSTAKQLSFECDSTTTLVPFTSGSAADGCLHRLEVLCPEGTSVTVGFAGPASSVDPEHIEVGPSATDTTTCGTTSCSFTIEQEDVFVRGFVCDTDTDAQPQAC